MVQSPSWEANWFAASQEIPRILWKPKVHYRTHKRPPPVPILGQPNSVHKPTSHLLEIHPNIIHPSTPRSPQWSLALRFPHQDPIRPPLLPHTRHMPCPSHSFYYAYHKICCDSISYSKYTKYGFAVCRQLDPQLGRIFFSYSSLKTGKVFPVHTVKAWGRGQTRAPVTLYLDGNWEWSTSQPLYHREETLIPIEREAGWEPWPVWTLERREKLLMK